MKSSLFSLKNILYISSTVVLLYLTSLLSGSIVLVNERFCSDSLGINKDRKWCIYTNDFIGPSEYVMNGIVDLYNLARYKDLSGMVSEENSDQLSQRFQDFNSGFNFNYLKGSRPNAGFLLLSAGAPEKNGKPKIELWDLNNQKVIKEWNLKKAFAEISSRSDFKGSYFFHPIILSDGSLVFNTHRGGGYLIRVNDKGDVIKINDKLNFHRSINKNLDDLLYVCISNKENNQEGFAVLDRNLNILSTHYISDIYQKVGLLSRLSSSSSTNYIHINDVEPLLLSSRSDAQMSDDDAILVDSNVVLISLKSSSSVLAYDTSARNIIWILDGFSYRQNDIDVIRQMPLKISVFDKDLSGKQNSNFNRVMFFDGLPDPHAKFNDPDAIKVIMPNTIQFKYSGISIIKNDFSNIPDTLRPRANSDGKSDYNEKDDTLIVEEQNNGRLFEYSINDGSIYWTFINSSKQKDKFWRTSWSRFYPENPLTDL